MPTKIFAPGNVGENKFRCRGSTRAWLKRDPELGSGRPNRGGCKLNRCQIVGQLELGSSEIQSLAQDDPTNQRRHPIVSIEAK